MKKLPILLLSGLLIVTASFAEDTSAKDAKWLATVQKMISTGETKVSTPELTRVNLLKEWAEKHGRQCQVEKTEKGYRVEVTQRVAKR